MTFWIVFLILLNSIWNMKQSWQRFHCNSDATFSSKSQRFSMIIGLRINFVPWEDRKLDCELMIHGNRNRVDYTSSVFNVTVSLLLYQTGKDIPKAVKSRTAEPQAYDKNEIVNYSTTRHVNWRINVVNGSSAKVTLRLGQKFEFPSGLKSYILSPNLLGTYCSLLFD